MIRFTSECPRCGTPNTLNADLYIDGDDVAISDISGQWSDEVGHYVDPATDEEGDLICPVCNTKIYVSAKVDLALVAQSLYVSNTLNTWELELEQKRLVKPWYRVGFHTDTKDITYVGYTDGQRWNGWECPRFKKATVESMIKLQCNDTFRGWYDEENDCFLFWDVDNDEEPLIYPGGDYYIDGEKTRLYAVGAWCWVWEATPRNYLRDPECNVVCYAEKDEGPDLQYNAAMRKWSEEEGPLSKPQHRRPGVEHEEPDLEGQLDIIEMMTGTLRSIAGRAVLAESPIEEVEKGEKDGQE